MPTPDTAPALPDAATCEQARLSRDARFDGLFFTAVSSTGIYCRPTCPAPAPRPRNVHYYANAAAAEAAGYRPCLRCRPELSPADGAWRRGDETVARALKLIDQGFLAGQPLSALAARVHVGERQLRRLFVDRLGAPPIGVHGTRRLLFAKQLLTETALPITEVALAAGFGSLRRFNTTFLDAYGMAPRDLRKREPASGGATLSLRLHYRPPYDFAAMLDFLRGRALPGVEIVDDRSYLRVVGDGASPGWLRASARPGEHALSLELHGIAPAALLDVVERVRRMFDLDADPRSIGDVLARDARLRPLVRKRPGLRLPSGWDGFEIAVRAVVGQQVSVAAARTITTRLAERFGTPLPDAFAALGLRHLFPTADTLADADFAGIGLTAARAATVRTMARALVDGVVDFRADRTLDDNVARWSALPGIGPWTAQYIALRALGHPDALPAEDLVLQKQLARDGERPGAKALRTHAEAWRPWRGYAVIHLWRDAALASNDIGKPATSTRQRSPRRAKA
ncbi:DNA-3-methyladenine glycosylase 2 family protein [Luteimonas aestuarii]|uniref:DNA-3-methyladenine glycosylase II n=1 Tax=Luteimonas aestuarii TaxID=453837 RepID=A0A4R5TVI3_9GAMM|nr:DNA-3-methyladenine glycosylase 2 [Luteimonas aestuarii]TDK25072.1 DNA-3-methyladenine glycosylase 2 family protein [Luteimonas aestuarii]